MNDFSQVDLEVVYSWGLFFVIALVLIASKVVAIHEDIKELKIYLNEIKKRLP